MSRQDAARSERSNPIGSQKNSLQRTSVWEENEGPNEGSVAETAENHAIFCLNGGAEVDRTPLSKGREKRANLQPCARPTRGSFGFHSR